MENQVEEPKVFEEGGYKFTVLNDDPKTVNKVRERIKKARSITKLIFLISKN